MCSFQRSAGEHTGSGNVRIQKDHTVRPSHLIEEKSVVQVNEKTHLESHHWVTSTSFVISTTSWPTFFSLSSMLEGLKINSLPATVFPFLMRKLYPSFMVLGNVGLSKVTEYISQEWQVNTNEGGGIIVPMICNLKGCCRQKLCQKRTADK